MKTIYALILFAAAQSLVAQPFTIKSYTIGAPGGAGASKQYAIKGIAGAHDAIDFAGPTFAINGGFRQTAAAPSGPKLRIVALGRNVLIAWPDPSTGFQPQQSDSLSPAAWTDIRITPRVVGTEMQVILPLQPGPQFFRLRRL